MGFEQKKQLAAKRLKAAGMANVSLFMDHQNSKLPIQTGRTYCTPNQAIMFGGEAEIALWALVEEMEAKAQMEIHNEFA